MRGLSALIIAIIFAVVWVLLVILFLRHVNTFVEPAGNSEKGSEQRIIPNDGFDYTTYLLSEDPVDLATYDECDKLKNAIKYAIINERPYLVDTIAYGSNLVDKVDFPFIGNCLDEDLVFEIGEGLEQVVCRFRTATQNEKVGLEFGGISDASMLYFDNCVYAFDNHNILPSLSSKNIMGPAVEETSTDASTVKVIYSPDHMYIENGDYSHYPFVPTNSPVAGLNRLYLMNSSAFDMAYNGGGWLNIYVGKAESVNGECRYNVYFCPRPAIASDMQSRTLDVFNIFRKLEIYPVYFPYYIRDLSDDALDMSGYSNEVYHWNYYDVDLGDEGYDVETIVNAIKAGLYFNVHSKGYEFAHPHWDIEKDDSISIYELANKIALHIGVKTGSGEICAQKVYLGLPYGDKYCTTTSLLLFVDRDDPIKSYRFTSNPLGDSFTRFEGSFGTIPSSVYTRNINTNSYLNAVFGADDGMIAIDIGVKEGMGEICVDDQCTDTSMIVKINPGTEVTISAKEDPGYEFAFFEGSSTTYDLDTFDRTINYGDFLNVIFVPNDGEIGDCWYQSYNEMLNDASEWKRTRSIRFNCGGDNVCSGTLRIKMAIRKDTDVDGEDKKTYVSSVVSFCDT
ncbi:MAG: hypothetical protein V1818_03720 [Candidatus Aenigmatarchaeota archaeon]